MNLPETKPDHPTGADVDPLQGPRGLEDVVHRIVWEIENELISPGEVAALRRLDPDDPGAAAFWKVLVFHVEPAEQLQGADAERRWALILQCVGELHALHRRNRRLGRAVAAANVSEMRLVRLLRADLDTLPVTLRAVARQLASAGEGVDLADVAWLVVTARGHRESGRAGESVRRQIARDYYRGLRKATEDSTSA